MGPSLTAVAATQCHPFQTPQVLAATRQPLVPAQLLAPQTQHPSDPAPTPGNALTAPRNRVLTQERAGKEFQAAQTMLVRHRAWPDTCNYQHPVHKWPVLFIPLLIYFPTPVLPKSPTSTPLPAFGFSPKHPILSLVQPWNAPPHHLTTCPICQAATFSLKGAAAPSPLQWDTRKEVSHCIHPFSPGLGFLVPCAALGLCGLVGSRMGELEQGCM